MGTIERSTGTARALADEKRSQYLVPWPSLWLRLTQIKPRSRLRYDTASQ